MPLNSADSLTLAAGKLHFVKFETSKLEQAVEFITAKGLHRLPGSAAQLVRVKATGGGAFKFTEVLQVLPLLLHTLCVMHQAEKMRGHHVTEM